MLTTRGSLLARVKDPADASAWREFDRLYRPLLKRYAETFPLAPTDVEDVVQDCMGAVSRHIREFDYDPAKGRFRGWLRTVVNNRVRSVLRGTRELTLGTDALKRLEGNEPSPDVQFEKVWQEEHVRFALDEIRQAARDADFVAFTRYAINGEATGPICADLSLTPGQLYKIKWRIMRDLSARLKELMNDVE